MNKPLAKVSAQSPVVLADSATVLEIISRAASDPNTDIAKTEKLVELYLRMEATRAKSAYFGALAALQPELPMIGERGGIKDRSGNIQSKYALWEDVVAAITPLLSKHGFSLSFRTGNDGDSVTVTGVLAHSAGHSEETTLKLPVDTSGSKNAVQSVGSSTSYGKRYTASALLNLRSGEPDDDGQAGGSQSVTENEAANIEALVTEVAADLPKFLKYIGADEIRRIPAAKYKAAIAALEKKRKQP